LIKPENVAIARRREELHKDVAASPGAAFDSTETVKSLPEWERMTQKKTQPPKGLRQRIIFNANGLESFFAGSNSGMVRKNISRCADVLYFADKLGECILKIKRGFVCFFSEIQGTPYFFNLFTVTKKPKIKQIYPIK